MNTVGEIYYGFVNELHSEYDREEAEQVIFLAFENVLGFRRIDISIQKNRQLSDKEFFALKSILERLKSGEPIQYILGYSWFYGMKLKVNPSVLIPRRETEELVHWIVNDIKEERILPENVLDICTGSGCIALAIKKEFPAVEIMAIDVSEDALVVATENSKSESCNVTFEKMDALNMRNFIRPDIIVSNPPYVTEKDKVVMHRRVTSFEPDMALYVDSDDPLLFYRKISSWAYKNLPKRGKIYFEINEAMDEELTKLLSQTGFTRIDFRKDFQGKIRMFRAVK